MIQLQQPKKILVHDESFNLRKLPIKLHNDSTHGSEISLLQKKQLELHRPKDRFVEQECSSKIISNHTAEAQHKMISDMLGGLKQN